MKRRLFIVGTLGCCCAGTVAWGKFESGRLEVTTKQVPILNPGRSPLAVLHLSDLHFSKAVPLAIIEEAVVLAEQQPPDLILLTGDYITHKVKELAAYGNLLRRLSMLAPTFATLGNHDVGWWASRLGGYQDTKVVRALLNDSGVRLLHNESELVTLKGSTLRVVGLGDLWADEIDAKAAFSYAKADEPVVVLSHNPDSKELLGAYQWDLMLCGHTHGGQIVVPVLGVTPFAPVNDHRYVAGLNPWRNRLIHTTRGIGNLYGVRYNCLPEFSWLRFETRSASVPPVLPGGR